MPEAEPTQVPEATPEAEPTQAPETTPDAELTPTPELSVTPTPDVYKRQGRCDRLLLQ